MFGASLNLRSLLLTLYLQDDFVKMYKIQLLLQDRGDDLSRMAALAGYWLQKCWNDHLECQSVRLSASTWPELPYRVVDLSLFHSPESDRESLVKIVKSNGARAPYCALSYRWPVDSTQPTMLTRDTMEAMSNGWPAWMLLKQIRDACTLTKALGINYLWVDALACTRT